MFLVYQVNYYQHTQVPITVDLFQCFLMPFRMSIRPINVAKIKFYVANFLNNFFNWTILSFFHLNTTIDLRKNIQ